ncbi:MAG TPA: SRPBCC family protein [Solirubrobacter sp.]|nr:SRPBCC family protein [Solirubrobacter sp.]
MMAAVRVQESIEIDRPLSEVFDFVAEVRNYPKWMAHALDVRTDAPGAPQQSDRFVLALKSVGRRFETPYERTSYEKARGYTDQAVGGPIPNHRWLAAFEQVPAGTRLTRSVEVESRGLLKLLEPLQQRAAARQLRKDLQTLKAVVEARSSPDT